LYDILKSLNMWYLWILTKAMIMLCLSLPIIKAYGGVHR
jgi:hypothetical protein